MGDTRTHNGNEYTEMTFPMYRKIGDSNYFKLLDSSNFLNVMVAADDVAKIVALGITKPSAFPAFMAASSATTAEDFDNFLRPIIDKIIELA